QSGTDTGRIGWVCRKAYARVLSARRLSRRPRKDLPRQKKKSAPTAQRRNPMIPDGVLRGAGIGLRHCHIRRILAEKPAIPWLEVHTENFFTFGSAANRALEEIAGIYPLSAHCIGLSLGSAEPVNPEHLAQVKRFVERFSPALVSDHLSWAAAGGIHLPDLLPVPYTEAALVALVANISRVQDSLGRRILIEN